LNREVLFKETKISFSDQGKGRAIVLLHGFPESREIWKEFSQRLSKRFRVIAIDLPGFGKTPCLGYVHSMDLMAEVVKAVMDHIGLRRYVLVGHSMGGYVAMSFARMYPDHLSGLCLFHSNAAPDSEEKKQDRDRAIEAVKADKKAFVFALVEKLFAEENLPLLKNEVGRLKEIAASTSPQSIIAALKGMRDRSDTTAVLSAASFPVLFIIGKKDKVMPWQDLLRQSKLAEKGRSVILENAAHMGFWESPETTTAAIKRFAAECFTK
jgi:pimeloyl-ACP methyl ester carboxylesterase